MNYFAHGLRFLDQPYFLAGTAVPDWISVVDRSVRVRPKLVSPLVTGQGIESEVAAGILQHFEDDSWFHATAGFHIVTGELTRLFAELLSERDGMRPGFLGHIVAELLLDAVLIEAAPARLDRYYDVLADVPPHVIESVVNQASRKSTDRLAWFIELFVKERFLYDYLESHTLLARLNQVLRRVKLQPLPEQARDVLDAGRALVATHVHELLPPRRFAAPAAHGCRGVTP